VIVAGLDMDFKGNPLWTHALMATAEYVTKVHAVCTRTGNLANIVLKPIMTSLCLAKPKNTSL
jgi:thymidine kinase